MIKLTINKEVFLQEISERVNSVKEITSPSILQEIAKATFSITGKKFAQAVDRFSVQNPKRMHHVYEWGQLGNPNARLFVIERGAILGGNLTIKTSFLPSKLPVPVPEELTSIGKTAKFVSRRSIFKDKANVMENGSPVTFTAKRVLTFMGNNGQVFVAPGTVIRIMNPGGIDTKNSFQRFMMEWYVQNVQSVMDSSGFYEIMVNEAAKIANDGGTKIQIRQAISNVASRMSGNKEVIK